MQAHGPWPYNRSQLSDEPTLTAAGHAKGITGVDFLVRENPVLKTWAPAVQVMHKAIGIETTLRTVPPSVWVGEAQKGTFAFEELLSQIDRELTEAKRQDLVRQAEAIFEQDPPLLPVSWEKIHDGWFSYGKGHNPYNYFGIYDVVRFDTFWLDK